MKSYWQLKTAQSTNEIEPIPTPKDKNFFKPQQFIWNNPYRSSPRLYKYFHQANDHYNATQAPLIKKQELKDKQNVQMERILKVIKNRSKTRAALKQRQILREALEQKSRGGASLETKLIESKTSLANQYFSATSMENLYSNSFKTSKSVRTLQKFNLSSQNQLPSLTPGLSSLDSLLKQNDRAKPILKKFQPKNKILMISFDLRKRNKFGGRSSN